MSSAESEEIEQEGQIEEDEEVSQQEQQKGTHKGMYVQDSDPYNGTFIFYDEDHTLGNILRYVLVNQQSVEFCGYSLPHPSETKMNLRLQTIDKPKEKVIDEGMRVITGICNIIESKFKEALEK